MALCFVFVSVVVVLTPTEAAVVAHLLHALAYLLNAVQDVKMRSENKMKIMSRCCSMLRCGLKIMEANVLMNN